MRKSVLVVTLLSGSALAPPANTALPAITGTVQVGQTLTASAGTWTGSPTGYAYQWKADGANVGTDQNTYALTASEYNKAITVTVTATNAAGSASATSDATSAVAGTTPTNSVAPTHTTTSVIGTQITATAGTWAGTPTPSLAYQWQRGGVNIGGATSISYTPVDADFGYALRVVETATNAAGSASANSTATNLTREAPAQTLGAELLANGNFSAWTGDNPDSWAVLGESGSDPMVTQVASDGSAGTGAARIYSSATNAQPSISQTILSIGTYYEAAMNITARTSGSLTLFETTAGFSVIGSSTGVKRVVGRAKGTTLRIRGETAPTDSVVDDATAKALTLNTQLTAPSADMRITLYYTLPVSPVQGDVVWVMPRISDFSAGDYWLVLLQYTGTQWDINLYSVATHTRTSRIAATNIGTTDGLRVNMNGSSLTLETTANAGGSWTSRGTATNSTYATATGVNALWASAVTAGNLVYEAAA